MRLRFQHLRTLLYFCATALMLGSSLSYAKEASLSGKPNAAVVSKIAHPSVEENEKAINNVKVFYNPVAEQIAVSFKLSKLNHVSIRVMDALGNEVMGLMNGELDGGIQSLSFDTNSKLAAGFYFVRVTSGSETVIKRISIR